MKYIHNLIEENTWGGLIELSLFGAAIGAILALLVLVLV